MVFNRYSKYYLSGDSRSHRRGAGGGGIDYCVADSSTLLHNEERRALRVWYANSWRQHGSVPCGYYLFAILFLMFDVETVFLFPWATICKELAASALLAVGTFLVILVLGLAYAWKKGALEWK